MRLLISLRLGGFYTVKIKKGDIMSPLKNLITQSN